jgi:hypothetical protein
MSQTATLYRISKNIFNQLNQIDKNQRFNLESAKSYYDFQGSFLGLEYILYKNQNNSDTELLSEIFNPKKYLGEEKSITSTPEEYFELLENGLIIPYIDQSTITKLNDFLEKISITEIQSKYDAKELNKNGIYPEIWQNDNSINMAYNLNHILEDFQELKKIIQESAKENDYIVVYIG